MSKKLNELKSTRAGLIADATKALDAGTKDIYTAKMAEVVALNSEIADREAIDVEAGRFSDADKYKVTAATAIEQAKADLILTDRVISARSGNEYATAFIQAVKNGMTVEKAQNIEAYAPLFNALTISGGTPAGADGGFLVPIDIDNSIREQKKSLVTLADLFTVENVTAPTGWRVTDTQPTKGFAKLSGELGTIAADDQPVFGKVSYALDTYALYLPMSKELVNGEAAQLMAYLARWFGKKETITDNTLLLALLAALTPAAIAAGSGAEIKGLKAVLNKTLDPNFAVAAQIITNQSGFNIFDILLDSNNRPLLQPLVTDESAYKVAGKPVTRMSDAALANGTGTGKPAPFYIGDFKSFGTLFQGGALEISATDVGGDAWRKNGYEMRAISRKQAVTVDATAVASRTIVTE